MKPSISVLMSVYNGEKYVKESIESVLDQSFRDFEFIIVNDGSTDRSLDIINSFKDPRIKVINNVENKGLIFSLNKGIEYAKGKYIIRFDADDICLKDRFKEQYEYMENNTDVAMMSAYAKWFVDGKSLITKVIKSDIDYEKIKSKFIFENHINHSCVILRKNIIDKENYRYDKRYLHIEDYGLWLEIAKKYKVSTLDKVLLKCRISKSSVTSTANKDMRSRQNIYNIIYSDIFDLLDYNASEEDYRIHFEISMIQNLNESIFTLKDKEEYGKRLLEKNRGRFIDNKNLEKEFSYQLYKNSLYAGSYKEYKKSYFYNINKVSYKRWLVDKFRCVAKRKFKKLVR